MHKSRSGSVEWLFPLKAVCLTNCFHVVFEQATASDRLFKNSCTVEDQTYVSTLAKQFNNDLCYLRQERSKIELSDYCKYCNYKFRRAGKELKEPVKKEFVYCKVTGCGFGATENGLCTRCAASVRQQPAAVATTTSTVAKINKPVEPEYVPTVKDYLFYNCTVCDKSTKGNNRFVGLCSVHQKEKAPKRKCRFAGGCDRGVKKRDRLFCREHANDSKKAHAEDCKRRRTPSPVRGVDKLYVEAQQQYRREGFVLEEEEVL